MFQRSITNKMRVKWALNPKALPTNFPHAAHRVGLASYSLPRRVYSISLLFTCIPCLPKLQAINVIEKRPRKKESEREKLCACMFAKVPLASAGNRLMFELSDLHKFMAKKAGVSRLDLASVHRHTRACLR